MGPRPSAEAAWSGPPRLPPWPTHHRAEVSRFSFLRTSTCTFHFPPASSGPDRGAAAPLPSIKYRLLVNPGELGQGALASRGVEFHCGGAERTSTRKVRGTGTCVLGGHWEPLALPSLPSAPEGFKSRLSTTLCYYHIESWDPILLLSWATWASCSIVLGFHVTTEGCGTRSGS